MLSNRTRYVLVERSKAENKWLMAPLQIMSLPPTTKVEQCLDESHYHDIAFHTYSVFTLVRTHQT